MAEPVWDENGILDGIAKNPHSPLSRMSSSSKGRYIFIRRGGSKRFTTLSTAVFRKQERHFSVAITISSFCKPDGAVVIKVKDNGFGIPLKDQSRIFEKYERASATERSRKGGASGFGLGLNYVFRVAEAHGGTVEVESIEGEYSEFSLSLPQKEFLDSVEEK